MTNISRREFNWQTLASAGALAATSLTGGLAAADTKGAWRVGIFTRPWMDYDYRTGLDAIADAGFAHAGLMTAKFEKRRQVIDYNVPLEEAKEIGSEVKQRDLTVPAIYGGPLPVRESLEKGIVGLKRLIDNCVAAGGQTLLLGGTSRQQEYDRYFKAVAECCDYAAKRKLKLAIKPHGGLNATGANCRAIIDRVGHENFSLWYDPGNIFFYSKGKLDPVEDAGRVDGLVRHGMCVKDFDLTRRKGELGPDVQITPGRGKVDFRRVMMNLIEGGFTEGDLVIETLAPGDGSLRHLATEAKAARQFVSEMVESLKRA